MKGTTTACQIFRSVVTALDKAGVDGSRAVCLIIDGAPSMVERDAGVASKFRENVLAANGGQLLLLHFMLHQKGLYCKTLK